MSTWRYARVAFDKVQWGGEINVELDAEVDTAIERWETADQLREVINSL